MLPPDLTTITGGLSLLLIKIKYEIIIIDDCCPEKSGSIALKYSKKKSK